MIVVANEKPSSTTCQRASHRSRRSQPVASVLRVHSGATLNGPTHPTSPLQLSPSKPDISTLQPIGTFSLSLPKIDVKSVW